MKPTFNIDLEFIKMKPPYKVAFNVKKGNKKLRK